MTEQAITRFQEGGCPSEFIHANADRVAEFFGELKRAAEAAAVLVAEQREEIEGLQAAVADLETQECQDCVNREHRALVLLRRLQAARNEEFHVTGQHQWGELWRDIDGFQED